MDYYPSDLFDVSVTRIVGVDIAEHSGARLMRMNIKRITSCSCNCGSFTVSTSDTYTRHNFITNEECVLSNVHLTLTLLTEQSWRLHVQKAIAATSYAQWYILPRSTLFGERLTLLVPIRLRHAREILTAPRSTPETLDKFKPSSVSNAITAVAELLLRRTMRDTPAAGPTTEYIEVDTEVIPVITPAVATDKASALQALDQEAFLDEIAIPRD